MQLGSLEQSLIDGWQRDLPLTSRPYQEIGRKLGASERAVLDALERMAAAGILSRVGATVRPNTAGASTLAALAAPAGCLEEIAGIVSAEPGVSHNYERDHALNLWFVVSGRDRAAVRETLDRLRIRTGRVILDLPLERSFVVDLGFPIHDHGASTWTANGQSEAVRLRNHRLRQRPAARPVTDLERRILIALADGLPLVPRPFAALASGTGLTGTELIDGLAGLLADAIVTRLGLILHHRGLGYRANAMAVWDIDDAAVERVGTLLAQDPRVSLCYSRPRRLPTWPYNLFCMVLGRERQAVLEQIGELIAKAGIAARPHSVLFSRRCFKQRGANLAAV